MVEFLGGPLVDLPYGVKPELVVSTSRGTFGSYQLVEAVPDGVAGHWRAQFDPPLVGAAPGGVGAVLASAPGAPNRTPVVPSPTPSGGAARRGAVRASAAPTCAAGAGC